jgi:hypothetical protein
VVYAVFLCNGSKLVSVAFPVCEILGVFCAAAARLMFRLDFLSAVLASRSCVTEAFFIFAAFHCWLGNPHAVKSDSRFTVR